MYEVGIRRAIRRFDVDVKPVRSAAFARGGNIIVRLAPTASAPNCLRETSVAR